ncbi:hypothetical protein DITRI_Ditri04bG0124900 [Diplodiscus trichospermus]
MGFSKPSKRTLERIELGKDGIQREGNDEGGNNLASGVKEQLKKCIPDSKVVMNHAKRSLYAGRHIQFDNRISEDGGNKSKSWKPNIQKKRLFSYILDRHIRAKVTTHALLCIDKAGGIDEYMLKTLYHKMDTEMGLFWKVKIEKMYKELGKLMEVVFFSSKNEAKFQQGFKVKDLKLEERAAGRYARRQMYGWTTKNKQIEGARTNKNGFGM